MVENLKDKKVKQKKRDEDLSSALRRNLLRRKVAQKANKEKSNE